MKRLKKAVAIIAVLSLLVIPLCAFPSAQAKETLNLGAIGDSITYGSGLHEGEVPFAPLVAEKLGGAYVNLGVDGNKMTSILDGKVSSYYPEFDKIGANCFAIAVGSNDFVAYLADTVLGVVEPGEEFHPGQIYGDIPSFLAALLTDPNDPVAVAARRFLTMSESEREAHQRKFATIWEEQMRSILSGLWQYDADAPVVVVNYYDPVDIFAQGVAEATPVLKSAYSHIHEANVSFDAAFRPYAVLRGYSLTRGKAELSMAIGDLLRLIPILQGFGLDVSSLTELKDKLGGLDLGSIEWTNLLGQAETFLENLSAMVDALDQLITFTDTTQAILNARMDDMAAADKRLGIANVNWIGSQKKLISDVDSFHPSASGQRELADAIAEAFDELTATPSYAQPTVTVKASKKTVRRSLLMPWCTRTEYTYTVIPQNMSKSAAVSISLKNGGPYTKRDTITLTEKPDYLFIRVKDQGKTYDFAYVVESGMILPANG